MKNMLTIETAVYLRVAAVVLALGFSSACQSSAASSEAAPAPPVTFGRWTPDFLESALLIADTIRIEGPPALRLHMALPQDMVALESTSKATNDGFLHVFLLREGSLETIRAVLDQWEIVAMKRLEVLERPNETDVRIVARGKAVWMPTEESTGSPKRRGPLLEFTGKLER